MTVLVCHLANVHNIPLPVWFVFSQYISYPVLLKIRISGIWIVDKFYNLSSLYELVSTLSIYYKLVIIFLVMHMCLNVEVSR